MCETATAIADLVKRLQAEIEFQHLRERWARHHEIAATTFSDRVAELADLCEPLDDAFEARAKAQELSAILSRTPRGLEPDWADPAALRRLGETALACETARRYEDARRQIAQTLTDLRTQSHGRQPDPTLQELRMAVTERDPSGYASARGRAASNVELDAKLRRRRALLQRVADVAPLLAGEVGAAPADPVWNARAANFERAWNWRRAEGWLTRLASPGADHQHRQELESTKLRIAQTIEELAAEKAWTHCFERMTEHERQHLIAWSKAVQRIGKGKGKYAPQHRRQAQEHLNESRSAIPAWVMPLHRVAETIKPGSELFDIAIIDEASQSGPDALLLAYLAKKLVVVGDDKQIQPTYPGVNRADVDQLRQRYLGELPHADAYGADQSFFDLAEIRYQGRIRLREHFRCMPEIIQFSNNLSYQGEPLIPLRQYGAGRLEPTVVTRHVDGGYQTGTASRAVNPREAEAIVDAIGDICRDSAYNGKTIGVINLVGDAQPREIETRLVRALGPEEMERRQIVCGNAYALQGDERDVMFLSMVSAPREGRRIPAMSDAAAQRRFNVAVSRARDQLFLFHTATLADLSPNCLRYQLLEYCRNPKLTPSDIPGLDVLEIERRASQPGRQPGTQPPPFGSWFEVDVFLQIVRRGYRVIPQHEVASYRIDLVVQGMQGSLAVECDGDAWHGPDQYEADVARQRVLERCGWTFWRVRESEFRLDPDEALSDLWKTLEGQGIFSTAEEERTAEEKRRHREATRAPEPDASRPTDDVADQEPPPKPAGVPGATTPAPMPAAKDDWLAPYAVWTPSGSVPNPRNASREELVALLVEVVEHEGPVVAIRAYRLINLAAGNQRLSKLATSALNPACAEAVRTGILVASNPLNEAGQVRLVLRKPDHVGTIPREAGPRGLDEIPPDELKAVSTILRARTPELDREALKRQLLESLGWSRLTKNVSSFLDRCIALM